MSSIHIVLPLLHFIFLLKILASTRNAYEFFLKLCGLAGALHDCMLLGGFSLLSLYLFCKGFETVTKTLFNTKVTITNNIFMIIKR